MTEDPARRPAPSAASAASAPSGPSRRRLLTGAGLGAAGAAIAAGGFGGGLVTARHGADAAGTAADRVAFRGEHQAGIVTPAQQQMIMVAFDMIGERRQDLVELMTKWSLAAERMMAGEPVATPKARTDVPPDDTGEAIGSGPSALTITFGFGATLFQHPTAGDRFRIADRLPAALAAGVPKMAAEDLDLGASEGDLVVQICSEDPLVTLHAMHQLKRIAFGLATVRWMQLGFGRTSSTSTGQVTPRNLFGFKDGTSNLKAEDGVATLNEHLWIQADDDGGAWAAGGTYLCSRKIHQMLEVWDELVLDEQQRITGRDKLEGAPLSGGTEFTAPDFARRDAAGTPLIAEDSHVAVVHPDNNGGRRMLRRGYNYTEGVNALGRLQAGLFFIAYVRDPQTSFVPILRRMAGDQLTEYLRHVATGLYIVPPGIGERGQYVGESLLG